MKTLLLDCVGLEVVTGNPSPMRYLIGISPAMENVKNTFCSAIKVFLVFLFLEQPIATQSSFCSLVLFAYWERCSNDRSSLYFAALWTSSVTIKYDGIKLDYPNDLLIAMHWLILFLSQLQQRYDFASRMIYL